MSTFFYAFIDELEKTAKIFGAPEPTDMYEEHPGIRHKDRMREFKGYVRGKSKEEPTSLLRAVGGGAAIGGIPSALVGALAGGPLASVLAAGIGGSLGALTGLGLRSSDVQEIKRVKGLKGRGAVERDLAKRLSSHMRGKESAKEMREYWRDVDREEHTSRLEDAIRESRR